MASALIEGMITANTARPQDITAADVRPEALSALAERLRIGTLTDSAAAAAGADVVVLSVKPQVLPEVLASLAGKLAGHTLVVSIAAGIPTQRIEDQLGSDARVIRAMPNTPALVGAGATGLCRGRAASEDDLATARAMFASVGATVTVPEALMDAVTALSGSGPAYVFRMMEGLVAGGVAVGLPQAEARALAAQTIFGAGKMLVETGVDPSELRRRVTSPGGTTAAGLAALDADGFVDALTRCIAAATARGKELGG